MVWEKMTLFYTTFSYTNWSMHLASQDTAYLSKYKLVITTGDFSIVNSSAPLNLKASISTYSHVAPGKKIINGGNQYWLNDVSRQQI